MKPKLGACYNLFDCEELLPASIRSVRDGGVEFVCVVYQVISNFGQKCHLSLKSDLSRMLEDGLIDKLVEYSPKSFSAAEKQVMVSQRNAGNEKAEDIQPQFFNELQKREIGRKCCKDAECTHFMSMDADEFYIPSQLSWAWKAMVVGRFEGSACRMRTYFKYPTVELMPADSMNWCTLIYKVADNMPFKLLAPIPILVDPTRRLENITDIFLFERDQVEMHHMSFVRADMSLKLSNVSNRGNLDGIESFLKKFESWTPKDAVIHPHPVIGKNFSRVKVHKDDPFNIVLPKKGKQ